jgi:hypothetical protein
MARKISVGAKPSTGGGNGGGWWGPKTDEIHEVTLLASDAEIVSVDQCTIWDINPAPSWVYCGSDDPSHDLGLKPGYRAFIPVLVKSDEEQKPRIWSMPISAHRALCDIAEMQDLKGLVVKVKKTGTGIKTKYVIVSTARVANIKKVEDIPNADDIISRLGPETREGIIAMIEERAGRKWKEIVGGDAKADDDGIEEL